jgi:hypothetical protein
MLSHLGYIRSNGERDTIVKFYKNMERDVVRAFQGCSGMAPTPPKLAVLQHLQGSVQSEEPICQALQCTNLAVLPKTLWQLLQAI